MQNNRDRLLAKLGPQVGSETGQKMQSLLEAGFIERNDPGRRKILDRKVPVRPSRNPCPNQA
jgi:hypothetical protein